MLWEKPGMSFIWLQRKENIFLPNVMAPVSTQYVTWPSDHQDVSFQLALPPAFPLSSSRAGAPALPPVSGTAPLGPDLKKHQPTVLTEAEAVFAHPLMLLLLPQDLVPLKQGLWFDRLPVLGLQSNRPVGMVVLLSTCSWLLCVCPLVCVLLPPTLLCCTSLGFPHHYREDPRGTLLNGKETTASSCVESYVIPSLLWQGQRVEVVLLLWILCHWVNKSTYSSWDIKNVSGF